MLTIATRGSTLDQPLVTIIAHRLSEYLADLKELDERRIDDIQAFLDQIRRVLEGEAPVSTAESAKLVRALPARQRAGHRSGLETGQGAALTRSGHCRLRRSCCASRCRH